MAACLPCRPVRFPTSHHSTCQCPHDRTKPGSGHLVARSPIGDVQPQNECPRSGARLPKRVQDRIVQETSSLFTPSRRSLHDEIDNAVECSDVDRANNARKEQPHHGPRDQFRPVVSQQDRDPGDGPDAPALKFPPVGIVCLATPRTAAGIRPPYCGK